MRLNVILLCIILCMSSVLIGQGNQMVNNNWNNHSTTIPNSENAYLGVAYNSISKSKAEKLNFPTTKGAYITRITEGSAAQNAGLRAFDYLTGINGKMFSNNQSFGDMMDNMKPNQTVTLNLIRDGQPLAIQTQLTATPEEYNYLFRDTYAYLGVHQSHDDTPDYINGTRIGNVTDGSTAKAMGMQKDDIIQSINDYPILDWHDLTTVMKNTPKGEDLKVAFYRESDGFERVQTMKAVRHGDFVDVPENEPTIAVPTALIENNSAVSDMSMEAITEEESEDMEAIDIDMPIINTLSIEDLNLFPNPNNGIFNLSFNLSGEDAVSIRIFAADGKVIYEDFINQFSGEYLEQINISSFAKGFYFLQVRQGENVLSKKIVLR